jgi:hypothetical protein
VNTTNSNRTIVPYERAYTVTRTFNTTAKAARVINAYLGIANNGADVPVQSMDTIALAFGTTVASVRRLLVANGITIRGRGRVAQNGESRADADRYAKATERTAP